MRRRGTRDGEATGRRPAARRRIATFGLLTALVAAATGVAPAPARPCHDDPVRRQFDFWLGEWTVTTPDGKVAGRNSIQELASGCLILENWTGASGFNGHSINFVDPGSGRWRQVWTDSTGGLITVSGGFRDGAMRFEGEHVERDGRRELFRMSFTPGADGTVRQYIEQSKDGGESWYVWFNGLYSRPGAEPGR